MPSKEQREIAKAIVRQIEMEIAAVVPEELAREYAAKKAEIRLMEDDCWRIVQDARRTLQSKGF